MSMIPIAFVRGDLRERRSVHWVAACLDLRIAAAAQPDVAESGIYAERERRDALSGAENPSALIEYWLEHDQTASDPLLLYDFDSRILYLTEKAWGYASFERFLPIKDFWRWKLVASPAELYVLLQPPRWWQDDPLDTLADSPEPLERVAAAAFVSNLDGSGAAPLFFTLLHGVAGEEGVGDYWPDMLIGLLQRHDSLLVGWREWSSVVEWMQTISGPAAASYVLALVELLDEAYGGNAEWRKHLRNLRERYLGEEWEHRRPEPICL